MTNTAVRALSMTAEKFRPEFFGPGQWSKRSTSRSARQNSTRQN